MLVKQQNDVRCVWRVKERYLGSELRSSLYSYFHLRTIEIISIPRWRFVAFTSVNDVFQAYTSTDRNICMYTIYETTFMSIHPVRENTNRLYFLSESRSSWPRVSINQEKGNIRYSKWVAFVNGVNGSAMVLFSVFLNNFSLPSTL